ncbi:polyprenyl synthetase family protein [Streptomyces sp. NPDC007162]|uniref:polyprenyl synthetase family protein n=1 Tax=Streptomyces sp. NPDC007162 TaxID=3156917 RepID=UPI0033DEF331
MSDTPGADNPLTDRLAGHVQDFEKLLVRYFDSLGDDGRLDVPSYGVFAQESLAMVRELTLRGGKRIRVVVLREAARLVTHEPVAALDHAALGVELLHTHGLIHDDLIDDSAVRRGGPSTYYAYRERFPGRPRTALGLTVLAGDLALALAVRVLLGAQADMSVRQAMVEVLTRAAAETVLGQVVDLERDLGDTVPDDEVLHQVADFKSARYSLLAPLHLGLLAAGEEPERYAGELRRYARLVGICAQMRDDYLDLFGDGKETGKPVGTDVRDGRRSYVVAALLSSVGGAERRVVEAALGDGRCSDETIALVRGIAEERGVRERLRESMRAHADQAVLVAGGWRERWRSEAVGFFEALPYWSVERSR